MNVNIMNFRKAKLVAVAALGLAALSLGGCVVYPSGYAYNTYGYAPAYVAPPIYGSIFVGGGWGGGWRGGGGRWR